MRQLSHTIISQSFSLETTEEAPIVFIRDEQGFLSVEDLETIVESLNRTIRHMRHEDKTQEQILHNIETLANVRRLEKNNWLFPEGREDNLGTFRCVYFVYSPQRNAIKIGYATNLTHRLWGIRKDSGDEINALRILAVIRTTTPRQLEYFIHQVLQDFRTNGEWFLVPPVLAFIHRYGGRKLELDA